jgi:hypothetical protein
MPLRSTWSSKPNTIIGEYQAQGFLLTLRHLFYQFVARGLLENLFAQYKRLGGIIRNARDTGLIDWDAERAGSRGLFDEVTRPSAFGQTGHRSRHRRMTESDVVDGARSQQRGAIG